MSYSDLLLSIATAQWKKKDARKIIHDYVDIMDYFTESEPNRDDCNINVVCSESLGWGDQINGAIRVTMGGGLCSASISNYFLLKARFFHHLFSY